MALSLIAAFGLLGPGVGIFLEVNPLSAHSAGDCWQSEVG